MQRVVTLHQWMTMSIHHPLFTTQSSAVRL